MKFVAAIILTLLFSLIAGLYLPWWSLAIVSFIVGLLIHQHAAKAFLAGFLALFLLWALLAWWIDSKNEGLLSAKIADLLPLGGSSLLLIIVTAFIGALVAGLAAMSGSFLRSAGKK